MLLSMEHFDGQTLEESTTLSLDDIPLVFHMVANADRQLSLDVKPISRLSQGFCLQYLSAICYNCGLWTRLSRMDP